MSTELPSSSTASSPGASRRSNAFRHAHPALILIAALLFAFLYAPLAAVVASSFNSAPHGGPWQSFTTKWYAGLAHDPVTLSAVRATVLLAIGSTAISTVLGTMVAFGLSSFSPSRGGRRRSRIWQQACETGLLIPIVAPDIVMAVAMLTLFAQIREHVDWLQPGLLTMTLAHVTFQVPFIALVVRARLAGFDSSLEEAARDLGATPWQTFWQVKLPLVYPGILAGALLALTLSLDDFVVSFFTTGPGATTLPILIYSSVKRGITPAINAVSTLLILAAIVATISLTLLQRRTGK